VAEGIAEVAGEPTADRLRVTPPALLPASNATRVAIFEAHPASAPHDAATTDLIHQLRSRVILTAAAGSQLTVDVGGITATFADFTAVIGAKLPLLARFPCSFFDPGLAELEVQAAAVPPGDGGVGGEAGLAQDG
jgi:uncharacterized membrane protein YdfJ with MMPL/SSD domain